MYYLGTSLGQETSLQLLVIGLPSLGLPCEVTCGPFVRSSDTATGCLGPKQAHLKLASVHNIEVWVQCTMNAFITRARHNSTSDLSPTRRCHGAGQHSQRVGIDDYVVQVTRTRSALLHRLGPLPLVAIGEDQVRHTPTARQNPRFGLGAVALYLTELVARNTEEVRRRARPVPVNLVPSTDSECSSRHHSTEPVDVIASSNCNSMSFTIPFSSLKCDLYTFTQLFKHMLASFDD